MLLTFLILVNDPRNEKSFTFFVYIWLFHHLRFLSNNTLYIYVNKQNINILNHDIFKSNKNTHKQLRSPLDNNYYNWVIPSRIFCSVLNSRNSPRTSLRSLGRFHYHHAYLIIMNQYLRLDCPDPIFALTAANPLMEYMDSRVLFAERVIKPWFGVV